MKKKIWFVSAAAVSLVGIAIVWSQARSENAPWQTIQPIRGPLTILTRTTGTVEPQNKILVSPPVNGRVDEILVEEGKQVRKGQVLAWMSSADRAALIDAARSRGGADLKDWEEMYKPTPILSPVAGTVIRRSVVAGQTVASTAVLFEISDRLIINAQVDETDLGEVREGQKAEVRVDAYPDKPFIANVELISHQAIQVNNVTVYEVRMRPETVPAELRSGMTATVNFIVRETPNALLIPSWMAEGHEDADIDLFVREADGRAVKRTVHIGRGDGEHVEVTANLTESDVVLYKPMKILSDPKNSPFGLWKKKKPAQQSHKI